MVCTMYELTQGTTYFTNASEKQNWPVFTKTVQSDGITAFESNMGGL